MSPRLTKAERWRVICADHEHVGTTYSLAGGTTTYGRLLGRTPRNELAEFDTLGDPVFDEFRELFRALKPGDPDPNKCFGQVLGVACDRSPSGKRYAFAGKIWCPVCSTANLRTFGPMRPMRFEMIDIPLVTHHEWDQLSAAEKRERVREALSAIDCLPPRKGPRVFPLDPELERILETIAKKGA